MNNNLEKTAADFFAGIGLVGLGLARAGWSVAYAVDYSDQKRQMYEAHFGEGHYHVKDVADVSPHEIPSVTLFHASFPCTDLSVAGARGGLNKGESSAFWSFVKILEEKGADRPPIIMLENVEGLLTSKKGNDIRAILETLNHLGYGVDLLLINASHFVPQSRVRLFILGIASSDRQDALEQEIILTKPTQARPAKVLHYIRANPDIRWVFHPVPPLPQLSTSLSEIVDLEAPWWSPDRSGYLFSQMFERHKNVIRDMMMRPDWSYGTVFRRMRQRAGRRQSTAELRYDGIAGCLRTPKGGSARQILIRAGNGRFDARLLNAIECSRLMGASEYQMSTSLPLNQALFGFGDAVCASVVEWIATNYLNPVIDQQRDTQQLAA